MLATGNGGHDLQSLPLACAYFGVKDVRMLIHRLMVIKTHRPNQEN